MFSLLLAQLTFFYFRRPAASVTKSPNFWAGTPPLLQKVRTFGLGPPHPPQMSITNFIICGVTSHNNMLGSIGGGRGPRQKARLFVTAGLCGGSLAKRPDFCNGSIICSKTYRFRLFFLCLPHGSFQSIQILYSSLGW